MTDAVVIGAGPAGLMAAEVLGQAGLSVTVAEAMPSVGRKFLMAGKSGLNITKAEPSAAFLAAYGSQLPAALQKALDEFGPDQVINWAEGLGQSVFTGSTGRVFPTVMKASPLLRAWLARLSDLGVRLETRWRWNGWQGNNLIFETPLGLQRIQSKTTILATGGASWRRLGANGQWAVHLAQDVTPFQLTNMGFVVDWSDHMKPYLGTPVKSVALTARDQRSRGEFIISEQGIEGGGIYMVSRAMRDGATLTIDLKPDWSHDRVRSALSRSRGKSSLSNHLRKMLKFTPVQTALLSEFGRPLPDDLAPLIKALPITHLGPRPIDEAISTACSGMRFDALTDSLMIKHRPGVFCAGEMLDWEAPTGGYLITGCLATGALAGASAAAFIG
ncbi:TIGR03862 family flavoprotein [Yoonia sp. GPGPB17]|uniref:TIGR03862 family flavoprotein n=1 Tax=Yoonia sp. GPGPB17 TaxID=3026147 RepID=UPI0030C49602